MTAPRGAAVFTSAWGGEPCYPYGGDKYYCHTPPINGLPQNGTNCNISSKVWESQGFVTNAIWHCPSGPMPPMVSTPAPTPVPPPPPPTVFPDASQCKGPEWVVQEVHLCKDSNCSSGCQDNSYSKMTSGQCNYYGGNGSTVWCCPVDETKPIYLAEFDHSGSCNMTTHMKVTAYPADQCTLTPGTWGHGAEYKHLKCVKA